MKRDFNIWDYYDSIWQIPKVRATVRLTHTVTNHCDASTDIHQRYQTSYTALHNGVVSHGAQFWGLRVFGDHTRKSKNKTNALTILVHSGNWCTWWTTIILITGKTWRLPNWAPCRDQDGAGSSISGAYLWLRHISASLTTVWLVKPSPQQPALLLSVSIMHDYWLQKIDN